MSDAATSLEAPTSANKAKPIQHHKQTPLEIVRRTVLIIIGAILVGVALEIFLVNNSIIDGGITGISIMSSYLSRIPIGVFLFILNLPFLILGYRTIGKTFALSTLLGVVVLSISTALLHPVSPFTDDILLAAVFGGIFLGAGTGIVIRAGDRWMGRRSSRYCLTANLLFRRAGRHVHQSLHTKQRRLRL